MGITNLWPLALLIFVPGIILLYLLKVKAVDRRVPALNLWREAYKNIQAQTPWERFRHHLLMYLQILALLLLILALMNPYLRLQGGDASRAVLCLDLSGSMNGEYDEKSTKFEEQKRQAEKYLSQLKQGTKVTILTADRSAKILANDITDLSRLKKMVKDLQPTDAEGNLQPAVKVLTPLVRNWEDYQMVGFADENVELGALSGDIIDLSSGYANSSLEWVSHTETETGVTVQAKVNHQTGEAVSHEINLYLGEQLYDVQELRFDEEGSQVVTFAEIGSAAFRDMTAKAPYIRAEINEKDGLQGDNTAYELLNSTAQRRILLVSGQNQFLEKALTLGEQVSLEKTTSVKNINPEKEYDLIVYDGQMPEKWYHSEDILVLAPTKDVDIGGDSIVKIGKKQENVQITVVSGEMISGMEEFSFGCSQLQGLETPAWGYSFMNAGEICAAYTGRLHGRNITVLGFDLHNTDLPVQMEFPILIQNILNQGGQADHLMKDRLMPWEAADMVCSQEVKELRVLRPDGAEETVVPKDGHAIYTETAQAGLYQLDVKKDKKTERQFFQVIFPSAESKVLSEIKVSGQHGEQITASNKVNQIYGMVSFVKPILLLLFLLLIVEWIVYRREQPVFGSKAAKKMAYALRLLVMLLVVAAFFDPSLQWKTGKTTTIFLVDVSDSMRENQEEALAQVRKALEELPHGEQAGVVAFGGDANIEQLVSEKAEFEDLSSMPVTSETNIELALQTALSLYPEYGSKRLVLLTDAGQNAGDCLNMSSSLLAAQVDFQVKKWDSMPKEEVYLSDLTLPDRIAVGDRYTIEVQIESTVHTGAKLQLYNDNTLRREETVDLQEGSNHFSFQDKREKEGFTNYRAVVIPDQDTVLMNNEYVAYTEASEKKEILVIEGQPGEASEFRKVLDATGFPYQVVPPAQAPASVQAMNRYATVLLENVYLDDLTKGFLDSVESYVKDYGGGLIAIGGDQSFALGGYRDTVLEKLLPVNMDHKETEELPELAMVMVIDHSSSMSSGTSGGKMKLQAAKEAAAGALEHLRDQDQVGVLSFDDTYTWVQKPQKLDDRDSINKKIMGIKEGGGTSIYPALEEAYNAVKKTDAQLKHVILLTDGQDEGGQDYDRLLENAEQDGITVSTVAVGQDADRKLLSHIANLGQGRDYQTNGEELSRIFAQEVYLSQGDFLVNRDFTPVITADSDIMDGLDEGLPQLRGYIATSIKSGGTAVWMDDEKEDPILAEWRYGLGTTIAFTTDVTNEWTGNYAVWDNYPLLWSHMIEKTIYDQEDSESKVTARQEGNTGVIRYENAKVSGNSKLTAVYTDRSGEQQETELDAVSGSAYEGRIPLGETGVYSINVRRTEDGELQEAANVQLTMQYSEEYRYTDDSTVLDQLTAEVGGVFVDDLEEVYQRKPGEAAARIHLTVFLLILAVILWLLDILNRRLPFLADGVWLKKIQRRRAVGKEKRRRRRERKAEEQEMPQNEPAQAEMAPPEEKAVQEMRQSGLEQDAGASRKKGSAEGAGIDPEKAVSSGRIKKAKGKGEKLAKKTEEPEILNVESLLQKQKERNSR